MLSIKCLITDYDDGEKGAGMYHIDQTLSYEEFIKSYTKLLKTMRTSVRMSLEVKRLWE